MDRARIHVLSKSFSAIVFCVVNAVVVGSSPAFPAILERKICMSKPKKPKVKTAAEIAQSIRNDWGNVKPYTVVHESKKYKRPKHKKREEERDYE